MKRMDYSMGLFVYYFGSKKYNDVAHHTIYFGEAYEKHLNKILKKILSDDISYYLHRPSATDLIWLQKAKMLFMYWFQCQIIYLKLIGSRKVINLKIYFR